MRRVATVLLSVGFAFSAFAQTSNDGSGQIYVLPGSTGPTAIPVGTPTATVPANGTIITAPTTSTVKIKNGDVQLEDIGFDPKVKRDPNGNVVQETVAVPKSGDVNRLRNDNGSGGSKGLRNDWPVTPQQAAAPASPSTVTVHRPVNGIAGQPAAGATLPGPTATPAPAPSANPLLN